MKAFDETPPNKICQKVEEIIQSLRNPSPPQKNPFLTAPNDHFIYTRVLVDYPDDLYNIAHEGSIVSGWIEEISSFWAANLYSLFLFSWDLTNIVSTPTPSPVICVGFVDGYIIAFYNTGASIFSFPEFKALRTVCSIPQNVNVTIVKYGIAGCNDGSLRKITLNPARCSISVSGILTLKEDDPVVQIVKTQSYYTTLTLNGHICIFSDSKLTRLTLFSELKNIINIWCPYEDIIMALDNNAILYTLHYSNYKISIIGSCQLIGRRQFQTAVFEHGILTAVDSDRAQFDSVLTARFGSFPVFSINRNLGGIHSIGTTVSDIKIFSSSGIYSVTEKVTHDDNEEIWRFCNTINEFWDTPVMEIIDDSRYDWFTDQLNTFFKSDFEFLSILSNYVLTILDDIKVIRDTKAKQSFSNSKLSDFFLLDRYDRFSLLRLISFEIRNKNQLEFGNPPDDLEHLIEKSRLGNQEAALEALSIITSYKTLPTCFPSLCNFMFDNGFYRDLLDCIIKWANSVLPDDEALAFENANCPWKDEKKIYSYHLRLCVYEQMNPLLKTAIGEHVQHETRIRSFQNSSDTDEKNAIDALKYALNLSNTVFQRHVLDFLENYCPNDRITTFIYPEMVDQMRMIGSRHLPTVLTKKGLKKDSFNIYIEKATQIQKDDRKNQVKRHHNNNNDNDNEEEEEEEERNERRRSPSFDLNNSNSILDRIKLLEKAIFLFPNDEKALKLYKCAKLLKDFLLENPNIPQDLFARDFYEINETLMNLHEYQLALDVMNVLGEKRIDVLHCFLKEASEEDVEKYLDRNTLFSQYEIAKEIYDLKKKDGFEFMFNCHLENLYIFKVLCDVLRRGKYREDVEFIKSMLERAGPINREIRQELADILCEITLELDSKNKMDEARVIRENQENCFLEQSFIDDINDL